MPCSPFLRPIALATLAALAACSETPPPAPPQNTTKTGLVRCSSDAECGGGTPVCNLDRKVCVCTVTRRPDNTVEDSCGAEHCNPFTGQCVAALPGCGGDGDCATDQYCDRAIRTCKKRLGYCEPCKVDQECGGPDDYCIPHPDFPSVPTFCGRACVGDGDCGPAGRCAAIPALGGVKQCVPPHGTCETAAGCTPDSHAVCAQDADCNDPKQFCDNGECMARVQICKAPEQVCDPATSQCIGACRNDADCGRGYLCKHGLCVSIGACRSNADCPPNRICLVDASSEGECIPSCSSENPCPLGQTCVNVGERNECRASCATNADCPLNSICTGSPSTCTPANEGRCQVNEACPPCHVCTAARTCQSEAALKHCETCNPNQINSCGSGYTCQDLQIGDGPRCYRVCSLLSPLTCPAGLFCVPLATGIACTTDSLCRFYDPSLVCAAEFGECVLPVCVPTSTDNKCGTLCQ